MFHSIKHINNTIVFVTNVTAQKIILISIDQLIQLIFKLHNARIPYIIIVLIINDNINGNISIEKSFVDDGNIIKSAVA